MTQYRRWIFEANATKEEFLRHFARALADRGLAVGPARVFDLTVTGHGGRGWIKVLHHPQGLDVVLKEKSGVGGDKVVLVDAVLASGRAAQASVVGGAAPP